MSPPSTSGVLLAGRRGRQGWLRVEGRGDHLIAPAFKLWAQRELAQGVKTLTLDLQACTGLDSTFLGTLAALVFEAQRHQGKLDVVRAGERPFQILQRMGMTQLTQVHQDLGEHAAAADDLSSALAQWQDQRDLSPLERTRFSLEAHRQLQETSPDNRLLFADVVELMEQQLRQDGSGQ